MNMRKALPLFVIATMMVALIPSALVSAAVTNVLSVSVGPVGTKTIVSGTITTYNGRLKIEIDANNDGFYTGVGEVLAGVATTLYADGYAYAKEITIPNAYGGARRIHVTDLDAAGTPTADSFFTVQTQYLLKVTPTVNYETGVFTLNGTIVGGDPTWSVPATALDLQFRIKDTAGTVIAGETTPYANLVEAGGYGRFVQLHVLPTVATNFKTWGVYTGLLDWDTLAAFPVANQGVATVQFTVRMTNKATYERTQTVNLQANIPLGTTFDKVNLVDPSGTETTVQNPADIVGGAAVFYGPAVVLVTGKNTALGTYTVKMIDIAGATFKTQTFVLNKAGFVITIAAAADYSESSSYTAAANIAAANQNVERMHTVNLIMTINYPDGVTPVTSADLLGGFSVQARYNTTAAATIVLDPLTAYAGPNKWTANWKIPKDAVKGKNYHLVVVASSITDQYGNTGPTNDFDSSKASPVVGNYWKVIVSQLYSGAPPGGALPVLTYPGALNNLARTLESKATADIRYPDNSRVMGSDLGQANGTVTTVAGGKTYTVNLAAADYNDAVGLWVMKWKIPWNAPIAADYTWSVQINNFKDQWGNKGPAGAVASANVFGVQKATITISELAVDKSSVQTDEQITASFKATYPSGDLITARTDLGVNPPLGLEYPVVTIYNNAGAAVANLRAAYSSSKWTISWIVPAGSTSGTYNVTVDVFDATPTSENGFADNADTAVLANCNSGPTAKKYVNFDVSRVSMTDVLAASNAAKAAADLASTKADAAKTAADTASTKADAAKVAADAATVAANAAKTAADGAKTAATSAQTTAQSAVTAATDAKTAATDAKTAATAAGTKADAATAAANAAKASADAAKAATDSLTTMVYVAIAASVVAALAAIFAVMQITKKIA